MTLKKLLAFDIEDLAVISAHVQDAHINSSDMIFLEAEHRFVLAGQRYVREDEQGEAQDKSECRPVGMHFERVMNVRAKGIDFKKNKQLQLLTVNFMEDDAPSGAVKLTFAGGAEIALDVECLEAAMSDMSAGEKTACPCHG